MKQISRRGGRGRALFLIALLIVVGGAAAFAARDRIVEIAVAPAPVGASLPTAVALTAEDDAFYRFVGTRLRALTAESSKLVALGESRSRNVVELQARANRIDDISAQIDGYLEATPIPSRFGGVVASYRSGIAAMRSGIAATKSAFLRFDWDGVAAGLKTFETGVAQVASAFGLLQRAAGVAPGTPSPETAAELRAKAPA